MMSVTCSCAALVLLQLERLSYFFSLFINLAGISNDEVNMLAAAKKCESVKTLYVLQKHQAQLELRMKEDFDILLA